MKRLLILSVLILSSIYSYGEVQDIVCGTQPGEIYFVGLIPSWGGLLGFYYSSDYGEHIELRDSAWVDHFGGLLADAQDSTLYRFPIDIPHIHQVSIDGGFSWNVVNDTVTRHYASGVIPGEIYRRMGDNYHRIERSDDFGVSFTPCACIGFPDSLNVGSIALGVDSGEVYMRGGSGFLYYSNDYGENFTYLTDLYNTWGISHSNDILNGTVSGEIYVSHFEFQKIWRVSNFGTSVDVIADFNLGLYWFCFFAISRQPGELYMSAIHPYLIQGGEMRIYHTTNYGQNWTMYEHYVGPNGIEQLQGAQIPESISIQIYPNPANAAFDISYQLPSVQQVNFKLYNTLGQQVWKHEAGIQSPGSHLWHYYNEQLPSGTYFLQLQTESMHEIRKLSIIK